MSKTIVAILIALGVLAATGTAGAWSPAQELSPPGQAANDPVVAASPDGTVTIAWRQFDGSRFTIYAATRSPGAAAFGTPQALSGPLDGAPTPVIAAAGDGSVTVAWIGIPTLANVAFAATRLAGATRFAAPQELAASVDRIGAIAIDGAPDGTVVVAYTVSAATAEDNVEIATRDPGSSTFAAPQEVDGARPNYTHFTVGVSVVSGGATTVGWYYGTGVPPGVVQAVTRTARRAPFGDVQTLASSSVAWVGLGAAADGSVTAAWSERIGGVGTIRAATQAPGATSFGDPQSLSAGPADAFPSALAVESDGTAVALWAQSDGVDQRARMATRSAGSSTFAAPTDVSPPGEDAMSPRVALASDDAATVAWLHAAGADTRLSVARRAAGSDAFGPADPLGIVDGGLFAPYGLAVAPDGAPTLAWAHPAAGGAIIRTTTGTATTYALAVARTGTGTGTISARAAGIDCGATCTATLPLSTRVTLTATPTNGSVFAGWSGACTGSATTCTFDLRGARSATATFTAQRPGSVRNLRRGAIGTARATVRWQAPAASGGVPLLGYQTRIRRGDRSWSPWRRQSASARSTSGSRSWTRLAPNTRYRVQIRAVNRLGAGPAMQLAFRTPARASLAVTG